MDYLVEYISANRGRYTRKAITDQLMAAGHDLKTIDEAWAVVNAAAMEAAESATPVTRWPVLLGLTAAGAVLTFVMWATAPFYSASSAAFATLWYVVSVLVLMAVGVGLTRAAAGGAWVVVVALGALITAGLLWQLWQAQPISAGGGADAGGFLAVALAALVTGALFAVHRYWAQMPYLAYAVPILAWVTVTGICVSPLLRGG